MLPVERAVAPDREPDPMQRQGVELADRAEIVMRRSALPHIVFGVDFEPADVGGGFEDLEDALGADARALHEPVRLHEAVDRRVE